MVVYNYTLLHSYEYKSILSIRREFSSEERGIYMAWGGRRRGAGRPKKAIKRIARTFRLSDEEFFWLKPLIMKIRDNNDRRYERDLAR